MPSRLRPKASYAADAILVGDPGRSLLLAQKLLEQPKMSNHARGLWGYSGQTPAGDELTVQATGMGGPSAALVLADLAKLGVRRAIRIGTCMAAAGRARAGELLLVEEAIAAGGSAAAFGAVVGEGVLPDAAMREQLRDELGGDAREARVASFDAMPAANDNGLSGVDAADLQTVAVLARARELEVAAAAVLIVAEKGAGGERLPEATIEQAATRAGEAAARVLST
jgi:purine-nucleoside phosphorylase